MKNNNCKILVLSDLNEGTSKTLTSSVSLAKIVKADINFFYVKKPTEVVEKESQLAAKRAINKAYIVTDKKIKSLVDPISEAYDIAIKHSFSFGNVKNEIEKCIEETKPDIIVLGKRKSKMINFIGDNITQFVLKKYKGTIMIADAENELVPNKELSLGVFNNAKSSNFIENIVNATQKPLKSFNIVEKTKGVQEESLFLDKKTIAYAFENGDNVIKNISNYLSINKINLLFVNREKSNSISIKSNFKNVINNLNCSLILTT